MQHYSIGTIYALYYIRMLFNKKSATPWPLVFFGILAVLILFATIVVCIMLFRRHGAVQPSSSYLSEQPATSPETVKASYQKDLADLTTRLTSAVSADVPKLATDALLDVRVPVELLDEHMATLLKIKKLPATAAGATEIRTVIIELEQKANAV